MRMHRFAYIMLAVTISASAQQQPEKHVVRASAEASVTAQPDRAQISIGVRTLASTAKAAADQNAIQTADVVRNIKTLLSYKGSVQTENYSISPHYEQLGNTNRQTGFEANNTVRVTVDDLALLPQLIDASTASGANSTGGISFSLRDDSVFRLQALTEATRKARTSAEAIAQALDLRVVGVLNAESGVNSGPVASPMILMMKASPTPLESGTLEIHATATVTLEVTP